MSFDEINKALLEWPLYEWSHEKKHAHFIPVLNQLTQNHVERCVEYRRLLTVTANLSSLEAQALDDVFPLPVRLFKLQQLKSVADSDVVKTMTSSGTSGSAPAKIYLDKTTSHLQTKILAKIMSSLFGKARLPMLIVDCPATVKNRHQFSARTAGILGFSMYGRDLTYALNDDMSVNWDALNTFCDKYHDGPCIVFGFTYIVWLHFIQALQAVQPLRYQLPQAILLHGGGWKKLEQQAVSKDEFKAVIAAVLGTPHVHNYYGMVEQTGSIFLECDEGHFHCSVWSDILVRDPVTLEVSPNGETGILQLFSLIPQSYPGHAILTEDVGKIIGEDACPCGRKGKYFSVDGRLKKAEVRGCSDTFRRE
ncbi:LuxE/PaaK family acyltransferase [Pseudoalteromonas xiamenensis]